jgi:hypothetical protein
MQFFLHSTKLDGYHTNFLNQADIKLVALSSPTHTLSETKD